MTHLIAAIVPALLAGLFLAGIRIGALHRLAERPLLTLLGAILLGVGYRQFSLPEADPEWIRAFARFGLAMLVFLAAQQCRLSRLNSVSESAFRLSLFGSTTSLFLFAFMAYLLVPGLDLWAMLIVAAALSLGGAPADDKAMLNAPIEAPTKCAARIEGAAALTLGLPLAIMLEVAAVPVDMAVPLHEQPIYLALAGFATGGAIGLLSGRLLKLSKADLPVLPFLVAVISYFIALLLGFDAVLTLAGAGILYAEEAKLRGDVRTRLWRSGEQLIMPLAFLGFGFVLGPTLFQADFLVWIMAILGVTLVRLVPRFFLLQTLDIPTKDRQFLGLFGGAPGAGAALFLLSFIGGPSVVVQDQALSLASATILAGLLVTRLGSKPLIMRLVHQTARARKRRYSPA